MRRDVATVANCVLCDTYFVVVVQCVPSAAHFRGRKGKEELENILAKIQDDICEQGTWRFLYCPTCIELMSNKSWQAWIQNECTDDVEFSPCLLYSFLPEEQPPLFINANASEPDRKPKWTLVQGVGPQTLEVDKSRSGRIHKPTLRQFEVRIDPSYPPVKRNREQAYDKHTTQNLSGAHLLNQTHQDVVLQCQEYFFRGNLGEEGKYPQDKMVELWHQRPVFMNWETVSPFIL